jgi:hypothetical protein
MKKLLLTTAALLFATAAATAGTVTLQYSEDAGPTTSLVFATASGSLATPVTTPDFTIASFSGITNPLIALPFLLQGQQIDVTSPGTTGAHTLHLTVLGLGLTAPTGPSILGSGFDVTGITAGWTVAMSTDVNGIIVGSTSFTGPLSNGTDQDFAGFNLPATFDTSIHFDISNGGVSGASNTGAALAAVAVPGPLVGAGLPGLLAAFGFGGWQWRRRKKVA